MRSIVIAACLLLTACGDEVKPPLVATDIVITDPIPVSHISAGYLSLANNTDNAIIITRVVSTEFESVEIHESSITDGVAKMRRVDQLTIPANSITLLERGGLHLMLMRPRDKPEVVSLSFYGGDVLLLSVQAPITGRSN